MRLFKKCPPAIAGGHFFSYKQQRGAGGGDESDDFDRHYLGPVKIYAQNCLQAPAE